MKIQTKLISISLLAGFSLAATAGVIISDNFDYADGSLVSQSAWANHSGNEGDLLVMAGQAIVQHGDPSEDANLAFTPVTGLIYFGIDISVPAIASPSWGTDNEYFAHFKDDGSNFSARLDIVPPQAGGDFSVGIASDESTADTVWATDLTFGTTYRIVVEYNQDTNIATLWVDANSANDTSIVGEDRADPGDTVTQFALRQSDSNNNEAVYVDNLVVGTSFADVVVPAGGGATWMGYEIMDGWVDTGSWMGMVYVAEAPWIFVDATSSWMMAPDEGALDAGSWVYLPM